MEREAIETAFKFLKKEELLFTVRFKEESNLLQYVFEDKSGYRHDINIYLHHEKLGWYFFDHEEGNGDLFSKNEDQLEDTSEWFQKIFKRVEKAFESFKKNLQEV